MSKDDELRYRAGIITEQREEIKQLLAKLKRIRDWLRYQATSEGGIGDEINCLIDMVEESETAEVKEDD